MNGSWGGLGVMLAPFVMCLILTGIHGYLGIHVLSRKVIFVDLALAQIAALGTTCAHVLGYDPAHSPADAAAAYWFSLAFTVLGAAVFAITRMRHEKVPQEAFIGIVYASASAVAILLLARAPGEGEHIRQMLVGDILLVRWPAILGTAAIYAGVGLFHFIFRRQFFLISLDPERAEREGLRVRLWDFLFYASFGVVVTSSVSVAGVLLVFTYLVVPAACAVLLAEGLRLRIALAWAIGALASLLGIALSYQADLPTGPSVVGAFAAALVAVGAGSYILRAPSRPRAAARVAALLAVAAALAIGLKSLEKREVSPHEHPGEFEGYLLALEDPDEGRRIDAIHHLEESRDPHALDKLMEAAGRTASESPVLEHLFHALGKTGDPRAAPALIAAAARPDLDPLLRVKAGEALLALKEPGGLPILISVAADATAPDLAREEALEGLRRATGRDWKSAEACQRWWEEGRERIRWRENLKKFQ